MHRALLLLTLTSALLLRLVNAVWLPWQGGELIVSDMRGYDRAAVALLEQRPLSVHTAERYLFHPLGSDTYHPPGYYYFLAAVYAVAGHSYLAVRIAQAVLGTVTCLIIYLLGKEVFGTFGAGLLAAALAAVYPPFIFYTGLLLTETLSTFLLALASWLLLVAARRVTCRGRLLALTGLVLGLGVITRSVLLVAVPCMLTWWVLRQRPKDWRVLGGHALALLLPTMLVIAPVTIRNYQIHHRWILISTNGGVNFFLGHGGSERLKDQVRNLPQTFSDEDVIGISTRSQPEEEAYFYRLGWDYLRGHVLPTVRSLPEKLRHMYWASDYWPASEMQADILRTADWFLWKALLLPLSLLGALIYRAQDRERASLLYLIALSTLVTPLVFWAQPRFRIPALPSFMALATGAVAGIYSRICRRSIQEGSVA